MEQLPVLASGSKATTTPPFYLALDHRASTSSSPPAEAPTPPPAAISDPSGQPNSERGSEMIKAKIMSHPLYPALLRAFIDCRKVCTNFQQMRPILLIWFRENFRVSTFYIVSNFHEQTLLIFCNLRSERRRRLLVGFLPSPVRSRWIQATGKNRRQRQTQSSISSW